LKIPRGKQIPYIKEEQTTQWPKEIGQKVKQRSSKHTHKTKDRATRTPLKTVPIWIAYGNEFDRNLLLRYHEMGYAQEQRLIGSKFKWSDIHTSGQIVLAQWLIKYIRQHHALIIRYIDLATIGFKNCSLDGNN
jgi:hypothetical protein